MVCLQSQWFIYSFISLKSPQLRSPPTKCGENIRPPSTEPYVDGRPTYNGVWPDSPRGSFMTLLPLPQCHAAFSVIPSTLAWVDESPVKTARVVATLNRVSPPHLLPTPCLRVRIHITLRYVGEVGFMRVFTDNIYYISCHKKTH